MIFGLPEHHALHQYQERCSTWDEAVAMHEAACIDLMATIRLHAKRRLRQMTAKRLGLKAA